MSDTTKIVIHLPENLVAEVDDIVALAHQDRGEFIREAIRNALKQRKREGLVEQMRQGYLEMATINLTIAKDLSIVEEEANVIYYNNHKLWSAAGYEY
jgi:CopG family transcriptional regulator/antitoxin EndoAI